MTTDFYEDDEPLEKIKAVFAAGFRDGIVTTGVPQCSARAGCIRNRLSELHRHAVACSSCSTCEANYVIGAVDDLMVLCGEAAANRRAVIPIDDVLAVFKDL